MSTQSGSGGWMQPSWRRLVASTAVLFVVILAFLVGRVRAGADPGLVREATQSRQPQSAPPSSGSGGSGSSGVDPQGGQGFDPGTGAPNGTDDGFGNALPDQGGAGLDGSGGQSLDPPSTHVS